MKIDRIAARTTRAPVRALRSATVLCPLVCFFFLLSSARTAEAPYRLALPGYHYSFPHDHFNHPDFQTEWWYYTGNLQAADGHRFGFELTFFREAVDRDGSRKSTWDIHDIYFAHLALSDLTDGHFYYTERTNRSGPELAGISEPQQRIWNGNWQVNWKDADQSLQAVSDNFNLRLTLHSEKPPVIHGENGISQKAAGVGHASHYISLTRLNTTGSVTLNGAQYTVSGLSWMDHEFFTHQLAPEQTGWDWMSLQLDDRSELMLFQIHRKDGSIDLFSAGTYVDPQGRTTHLRINDFALQPESGTWRSPASSATYPIRWGISVPSLGIDLHAKTLLPSQELAGGSNSPAPTYWEGAIDLSGKRSGTPLTGKGYLEMTGYAAAVGLSQDTKRK
ncbi:MAG: carotenoid 1,2-hydratase [Acidobacteriota bacterium]|nr:carotenoid 1,2-hydratase [Acidobacteriota bacterium]